MLISLHFVSLKQLLSRTPSHALPRWLATPDTLREAASLMQCISDVHLGGGLSFNLVAGLPHRRSASFYCLKLFKVSSGEGGSGVLKRPFIGLYDSRTRKMVCIFTPHPLSLNPVCYLAGLRVPPTPPSRAAAAPRSFHRVSRCNRGW